MYNKHKSVGFWGWTFLCQPVHWSEFSRKKQNQDWLQAGEAGRPVELFQLQLKGLRTKALMLYIPVWVQRPKHRDSNVWVQEMMDVPAQARQWIFPSSTFCFTPALDGLDAAYLLGKEQIFFSQSTDSDAPVRNTFPDTPRNHVLPAVWVSLSLAKLTYKINQCTSENTLNVVNSNDI